MCVVGSTCLLQHHQCPAHVSQGLCSWGQLLLSQHAGGSPASFLGSNLSPVHWIVQCLTVPGALTALQSAEVWRGDGRREVHRLSQQRIIGSNKCDTGTELQALRTKSKCGSYLTVCLEALFVLFILSQGCLRGVYKCCPSHPVRGSSASILW